MILAASILFCLLGQSPAEIKKLEKDRKWMYEKTQSSFEFGMEGASTDIYFPVGRADRVFYYAFIPFTKRIGNRNVWDGELMITCWQRVGSKVKKAWQMSLEKGRDKVRPKGLLLKMADEIEFGGELGGTALENALSGVHGFRANRKSPQWKVARADLERTEPLVDYYFGQHGDVSLDSYVNVTLATGESIGRIELTPYGRGDFVVPPEEIKLMKKRRKK